MTGRADSCKFPNCRIAGRVGSNFWIDYLLMRILFVCSRNRWRSPTAEEIYRGRIGFEVRSAGTEPSARVRVTLDDIRWAQKIFVMERKHKERIVERFSRELGRKEIIVLDIEDEYQFMDEELIDMIKVSVDSYLV